MKMLEIQPLDNGGHRNQTFHGNLPDGWAVVPEDMQLENFPFGEVTEVQEIDGLQTVTGWQPGEIPEPEPEPEPPEPSSETEVWDALDKAYQEGVDSV